MIDLEMKADAYFTALLYAYNRGTSTTKGGQLGAQVVIGDMPTLIYREMVGRKLQIKQMQEMFKRTCDIWEAQKSDNLSSANSISGLAYEPQVHEYKEVIVEPRV